MDAVDELESTSPPSIKRVKIVYGAVGSVNSRDVLIAKAANGAIHCPHPHPHPHSPFAT
jgi:hypothetical protein